MHNGVRSWAHRMAMGTVRYCSSFYDRIGMLLDSVLRLGRVQGLQVQRREGGAAAPEAERRRAEAPRLLYEAVHTGFFLR